MRHVLKLYFRKFLNTLGYDLILKRNRNFDSIIRDCFEKIQVIPKVVVDVGASDGSSLDRFNLLFDSPKIYAFECNPDLADQLVIKYKESRIRIMSMGLGSKAGHIWFNNHNSSIGSSSILDFNPEANFASRRNLSDLTVERLLAEIITLDQFYEKEKQELKKEGGGEIDFLKIDTQGTELDVLRGASNLLKKQLIKFIELEIITTPAYLSQEKWSMTIDYLLSNGYQLVALSNDGRFYNLGPFDIIKNPELQFDCLFTTETIYRKLLSGS